MAKVLVTWLEHQAEWSGDHYGIARGPQKDRTSLVLTYQINQKRFDEILNRMQNGELPAETEFNDQPLRVEFTG